MSATHGVQGLRAAMAGGAEWSLQRALTVGYGVVYDYIFDRFAPYQSLSGEVLACIKAGTPADVARRDVRVLDIGCGPGNIALLLAEAGFSVLGIDPYEPLVELAREKRRARRLGNVAFQQANVDTGDPRWIGAFDQVVNVHSLYAHPRPLEVLRQACRALKLGGRGVFVNFTRRVPLCSTFQAIRRREGLGSALRCLRWVLPNAIFEAIRQPIGPHYWAEAEFAAHLHEAGFTVLDLRRTFFDNVSLLAWVRKDSDEKGG